jgi:hypothetical protein
MKFLKKYPGFLLKKPGTMIVFFSLTEKRASPRLAAPGYARFPDCFAPIPEILHDFLTVLHDFH